MYQRFSEACNILALLTLQNDFAIVDYFLIHCIKALDLTGAKSKKQASFCLFVVATDKE